MVITLFLILKTGTQNWTPYIIDDVRNRVAVYEDSVRHHYEMIEMAAYKDSLAKQLNKEANDIKERLKK